MIDIEQFSKKKKKKKIKKDRHRTNLNKIYLDVFKHQWPCLQEIYVGGHHFTSWCLHWRDVIHHPLLRVYPTIIQQGRLSFNPIQSLAVA